jgi:hypothetical protein
MEEEKKRRENSSSQPDESALTAVETPTPEVDIF